MKKGDHTFKIQISYEKCPFCGFINENRDPFSYHNGFYTKEVECFRCGKHFEKQKPLTRIGPIFGEAESAEVDWED